MAAGEFEEGTRLRGESIRDSSAAGHRGGAGGGGGVSSWVQGQICRNSELTGRISGGDASGACWKGRGS
jgi:hypothetical protein